MLSQPAFWTNWKVISVSSLGVSIHLRREPSNFQQRKLNLIGWRQKGIGKSKRPLLRRLPLLLSKLLLMLLMLLLMRASWLARVRGLY